MARNFYILVFVSLISCFSLLKAESIVWENPFEHTVPKNFGVLYENHFYASSNIIPIQELDKKTWKNRFRHRPPFVWGKSEVLRGARYRSFGLAYLEKREVGIEGNKDFGESFYFNKSNKNPPIGKFLNGKGTAYGIDVTGWQFSYQKALKRFRFFLSYAHLTGREIQNIELNTKILVKSEKEFELEGTLSQNYNKNLLYDQRIKTQYQGRGYSTQFFLEYQVSSRMDVQMGLKDFGGQIHWTDLPISKVTATNKKERIGGKIQPAIKGFERFENYNQSFVPKTSIVANVLLSPFAEDVRSSFVIDYFLNKIIPSFDLILYKDTFRYSVTHNYFFKTLGFGISHNCCFLRMESDSTNLNKAYTYGASGGIAIPL